MKESIIDRVNIPANVKGKNYYKKVGFVKKDYKERRKR